MEDVAENNEVLEVTEDENAEKLKVTGENESAKTGLSNSYGLAKGTGKLIGGGYRTISRFSKTMKKCGEKIAGVEHREDGEESPYTQLADLSGEELDGESVEFKPSNALDPDEEEATSSKRAARALVAALESDLEAAMAELEEMRSRVEGTNSPLAEQVKALQKEKKSLLADLEQARSQADEMVVQKDVIVEQVAVLESELAAAKEDLQKAHNQAHQEQDELTSQLKTLQIKNEALIADLEKVQGKVDKTKLHKKKIADAVQADVDCAIAETEQIEVATELVEEEVIPEEVDQPIEIEEQEPEVPVDDEVVETETPYPVEVTVEEIDAAVFNSATEKIIFAKALSDMSSYDKMVRIDSAKAVCTIQHELSVRALVFQLEKEHVWQVKAEYINALTELNMKEGLPAIERALNDNNASVRLASVRGLYRLAGDESGSALIRMFSDENESIRRRAAVCIGWLGKKELALVLAQLLDDSSISVQQAAIEAMTNLRSRAVVSTLIEHLNAPEGIRKAIISALKTITGKKMSGPFPKDENSLKLLIVRWRDWWKDQKTMAAL